jgi:hypothetical protein
LTVEKDPWLTPHRKAGVSALALIMLAQMGFAGSSLCGWGSLAGAGLVSLAPSALFLFSRQTYSALVSAVVVLPFMAWANVNECWGSHTGGGAGMAYVVVFLFGVPAAVFSGVLTLVVSKRLSRQAASGE